MNSRWATSTFSEKSRSPLTATSSTHSIQCRSESMTQAPPSPPFLSISSWVATLRSKSTRKWSEASFLLRHLNAPKSSSSLMKSLSSMWSQRSSSMYTCTSWQSWQRTKTFHKACYTKRFLAGKMWPGSELQTVINMRTRTANIYSLSSIIKMMSTIKQIWNCFSKS